MSKSPKKSKSKKLVQHTSEYYPVKTLIEFRVKVELNISVQVERVETIEMEGKRREQEGN